MWESPKMYGGRCSGLMRLKCYILAIKENAVSGANSTQHITSPKENHPHSEIRWWQHHAVGMFLSSRNSVHIDATPNCATYLQLA